MGEQCRVGMYGKLTETPLAGKRRLFDVDFWGVVHGCRMKATALAAGIAFGFPRRTSSVRRDEGGISHGKA